MEVCCFSPTRAYVLSVILITVGLFACKSDAPEPQTKEETLQQMDVKFTLMEPGATGVNFVNEMKEDYEYNNFSFANLYNGSGVAVGDVNGDGLPDIYFSSTRYVNRLYINQGNFKFADVSKAAGVDVGGDIKTGVSMADVNGDGLMDIYLCRTSKSDNGKKSDQLFINKGNQVINGIQVPVFEDQAKAMGIDDNSNTNTNCFFDYDRDGDLDLFLVCHKLGAQKANELRLQQNENGTLKRLTHPETIWESNRLYRNDNGKFTDVTEKAGVVSSAFGLGVVPADFNQDGWLDLYVTNDYVEPDYIYINNKNGTFTDHYHDFLRHSSQSSMGADVADFNNDGLVDIMVLDMKPEDPVRYKMLIHNMVYDRYNLLVQHGYGRQQGRNVLQLNNGNQTFSEIGQYAGVSMTDWSWGVLMADFDNDGWKDMYVSNGYRKDVTQLDYLNYFRDSIKSVRELTAQNYPDINEFIKFLPETKIPGYLYINDKNLKFRNATRAAGMDQLSFSNGCAYADFDADGDLDIVVNNMNDPAFLYRNDSRKQHWLQIDLQGPKMNIDAIGATADVYAGGLHQYQMMNTSKGFYSSSEAILHFGLGEATTVDSIILHWPDGAAEKMDMVAADQRLVWKKGDGKTYKAPAKPKSNALFSSSQKVLSWQHQDDAFVDLKRERLIPYNISSEGPCLAVGDINGDQLEDVYAGNGRGFPSAFFLQTKNGTFSQVEEVAINNDAAYEDCGAVLEDFDGDKDLDLVVISGGNDLPLNDPGYMTRYYTNNGSGSFTRESRFPTIRTNAGAILALDYDNDQDKDVFIAGRATPGGFPTPPKSYLLRNDNGTFVDVTAEVFKDFDGLGMITDLETGDLDSDGKPEVIVAGEWMPISIFSYNGKQFVNRTTEFGLTKTDGWWKAIQVVDIDGDGDHDVLAGNMGLNHRFPASSDYPITLVANDFDGNGSLDPIMCFYHDGKLYPFAGRDFIIGQIPRLKKKFIRYKPYASASLQDIFTKQELDGGKYYYAYTFHTTLFKNNSKKLEAIHLPGQAQISPAYDFVVQDFNGDGRLDILMAGNFIYAEPETGEIDAGNGVMLVQNTSGGFDFVENRQHGFWAQKEVRELKTVKLGDGRVAILTGNNRGPIEINTVNKPVEYEQ